jgi:hypothetical protein
MDYVISIRIPDTKLSLIVGLLHDTDTEITVTPVKETIEEHHPHSRKRSTINGKHVPELIWDILQTTHATSRKKIEAFVISNGYARNSASSSTSRLVHAGLARIDDKGVYRIGDHFDHSRIIYNNPKPK